MIFGFEGGLLENEILLFSNISIVVGFGLRILWVEIVLLYVLSVISYEKELMGWIFMLIVVFYILGCKVNYYEIEVIW